MVGRALPAACPQLGVSLLLVLWSPTDFQVLAGLRVAGRQGRGTRHLLHICEVVFVSRAVASVWREHEPFHKPDRADGSGVGMPAPQRRTLPTFGFHGLLRGKSHQGNSRRGAGSPWDLGQVTLLQAPISSQVTLLQASISSPAKWAPALPRAGVRPGQVTDRRPFADGKVPGRPVNVGVSWTRSVGRLRRRRRWAWGGLSGTEFMGEGM